MHGNHCYDVAILSDFRYPGGTSASIVEEIQAQARAGLTTALVHVPASHLRRDRSFNPRITECLRTGAADLALPGERVDARVLVIRQPRIFTAEPDPPPRIEADEAVMVVNQPPRDLSGEEYYQLDEVRARVQRLFGDHVRWVPIGPLVRDDVSRAGVEVPWETTDWHNIIDTADWWVDRTAPVADVPVIGRHSRPDPKKWPVDAEEIRHAYPTTGDVRVRVLGGGEHAVTLLGETPATWDILPFGAVHPRDFLRTIDFFVYFHDPGWVEAFGRTILEAMASGAPAILPEHFRPLFGEYALYATPAQVPALVESLYTDWDRFLETSRRGRAFVEQRFGYASHLTRLERLGVAPPHTDAPPDAHTPTGLADATPAAASPPTSTVGPPAQTRHGHGHPRTAPVTERPVMLVSTNGLGLGHVTRLMAVARRLPADVPPVIATQSQAAPLVREEGFLTEYIPSRTYLDVPGPRWNPFLTARLSHLIAFYGVRVVVVDTPAVYNGVLEAISAHPEVSWVWSRRAMWKEGLGETWIERGQAFDHVLEPGEYAAAADVGLTVSYRHEAHRVNPITYLDRDELLDPAAARKALALPDGPAALVQMGASYEESTEGRVSQRLREHGFTIVTARSPLLPDDAPVPSGTQVIEQYPLSQYLRGFDLVVTAVGYNSYHEVVSFGVPAILCPQPREMDDQAARALYADQLGVARALQGSDDPQFDRVVRDAADAGTRAEMARRCEESAMPNGAAEAARWLAELARSRVTGAAGTAVGASKEGA